MSQNTDNTDYPEPIEGQHNPDYRIRDCSVCQEDPSKLKALTFVVFTCQHITCDGCYTNGLRVMAPHGYAKCPVCRAYIVDRMAMRYPPGVDIPNINSSILTEPSQVFRALEESNPLDHDDDEDDVPLNEGPLSREMILEWRGSLRDLIEVARGFDVVHPGREPFPPSDDPIAVMRHLMGILDGYAVARPLPPTE